MAEHKMNKSANRVFSGIQPSGDIHIGNYLGAVKKWVDLCDSHDCIYCVVDDHAITVDYDVSLLPQRTFDAVLATMACGLSPDNCTLFVQSHVPEHTELTWLFNTVTPLGSLFRMTQFKDKARNALQRALNKKGGGARKSALHQLKRVGNRAVSMAERLKIDLDMLEPGKNYKGDEEEELVKLVAKINDSMGFIMQHLQTGLGVADASNGLFSYPVLQAADILLYKASLVPVGEDQEQHLELCREVAQRFNKKFGNIFPMVKRIEGEAPKILGLDGRQKMSKSLNNYIGVLESKEEISAKLKPAFTDPDRIKRNDPGTPEKCNIFSMHELLSESSTVQKVKTGCKEGHMGCFECKQLLADSIDRELAPIRERAARLKANPNQVKEALAMGRDKASAIAKETINEVKDVMGIGLKAFNGYNPSKG
jgi:tryptophanyl-tRNA synthetase